MRWRWWRGIWLALLASVPSGATDPIRLLGLICTQHRAPEIKIVSPDGIPPGLETEKPSELLLRFYRSQFSYHHSASNFPQVDFDVIEAKQSSSEGGAGNREVVRGTLDGKPVLVKVINERNRSEQDYVVEARWYLYLNKLGLGPEFVGMTRTQDGALGIVMRYVPGVHFPVSGTRTIPIDFKITDEMIVDIRRAGRVLTAAGIGYAPDLQFRLTREGRAVLVDPEFFDWDVPRDRRTDMPGDPIRNADEIAQSLWKLREMRRRR